MNQWKTLSHCVELAIEKYIVTISDTAVGRTGSRQKWRKAKYHVHIVTLKKGYISQNNKKERFFTWVTELN